MAKEKKTIHLLSNAHIDPVWLWQWPEGAAVALSTFRTAAELCEKNKTYVFNHNEAILYQWILQYEPELFKRIQRLVKAGRWHIMGGWFLQPDCNMPSGESFVRQILAGRQFFKTHFGVQPTTALNFDPFGHTRGLVQIMAKSGYDSYLFGRPQPHCLDLPAEDFVWVGYDGSEVMVTRFGAWYNTRLGTAGQEIKERMELLKDRESILILWGVGNHGGGPSRKDVSDINRLIQSEKRYDVRHSTPEAYFSEMRKRQDQLVRHAGDINPWAPGCYTSQIRVKQKHRQLENELFAVEKMATAAAANKLMAYPRKKLQEAQRDLLFSEFHDTLPGTSIQPAEEDALVMLDHGLHILSQIKVEAFFALSAFLPKAKPETIPVLVYNPHPYPVKQVVECELHLADYHEMPKYTDIQMTQNGKAVPCQVEKELSDLPIDWRKRISFQATLQPGQVNRFDCRAELLPRKPARKLKPRGDAVTFKTDDLQVRISTRTGLLDRYRVRGADALKPKAFEPLVMQDNADPWEVYGTRFSKVAGRFKLMNRRDGSRFTGLHDELIDSVRVIEDGPVRTVVEAVFQYNNSFLIHRYKLPKKGTEIEVECRVFWLEKDRMLKLSVPAAGDPGQFLGQVAYGVESLPTDGSEAIAHKWVAVVSKKPAMAVTCIDDGIYGCDYSDKGLRLSLLRSPVYSCIPWEEVLLTVRDRYAPRIDQGERVFRFWLNAGKTADRLNRIDREAAAKNEAPYALSFFPPGQGAKPKPAVLLDDKVIQLTTLKLAESNKDLIVRLFEPTGRKRSTTLVLPTLRKRRRIELNGFEIKTLRISANGTIKETDLMEKVLRG